MSIYRAERDITPAFLSQVNSWIGDSGEVFVVLRYLSLAGQKDFAFCRSHSAFRVLCDYAPTGTDIVVFRRPQLSLRGTATTDFIKLALQTIPDGTEYLIIDLMPSAPSSPILQGRVGMTESELREDLDDLLGREVAAGLCPNFTDGDHDYLISAAKGGVDGPR